MYILRPVRAYLFAFNQIFIHKTYNTATWLLQYIKVNKSHINWPMLSSDRLWSIFNCIQLFLFSCFMFTLLSGDWFSFNVVTFKLFYFSYSPQSSLVTQPTASRHTELVQLITIMVILFCIHFLNIRVVRKFWLQLFFFGCSNWCFLHLIA